MLGSFLSQLIGVNCLCQMCFADGWEFEYRQLPLNPQSDNYSMQMCEHVPPTSDPH